MITSILYNLILLVVLIGLAGFVGIGLKFAYILTIEYQLGVNKEYKDETD